MYNNRKISNKSFITYLVLGLLLINSFTFLLTFVETENSKKQYEDKARTTTKNYTDFISNNIEKTFEKADLMLNNIVNDVESNINKEQIIKSINSQKIYLNDLSNISITDTDGNIFYDLINNSNLNYKDLKNKPFFIETAKQLNSKLIISEPENVNDKDSVIILSKKIFKNNKFYGITFAVLPTKHFNEIFNKLDIGPNGSIALRSEDMKLVARYPSIKEQNYKPPSSNFINSINVSPNQGYYIATTPVDNKKRLFSYKGVYNNKFYVTTGMSDIDYLTLWRHQTSQTYLFLTMFCIFSIVCSIVIYKNWIKNIYNDKKLSSILNSAGTGIYGVDIYGLCNFCNNSALKILGFKTESELLGQPINSLIFKNPSEINCEESFSGEKTMYKENGDSFPADFSQSPQYLYGNVIGSVITFIDISDKKNMSELVWKQANYDSLTGLSNRTFFEDQLKSALIESHKDESKIAVMFIDLDHFKEVNDSAGHHTGDELLKLVSLRLQNCVRKTDVIARMGGDEFTILLKNIENQKQIESIANKIINELEKTFHINNHNFHVGASIGITVSPQDATDLEILLQNADKAMYVAKSDGRNCFHFFSTEMNYHLKHRLEIYHDLEDALEKNWLELYIQPIINTNSKIIKGEILLRLNHPSKGYISPNEFIPIAEQMGLIGKIGDFVFKESTLWLDRWIAKNNQEFQLSINVSPLQFLNHNLINNWKEHLSNLNIPSGSIIIEITEGLLLDEKVNILDKLNQLQKLGIKIAIDDFGTGYSAMSYLYKYDIDFIKIDRSFISNLSKDKNRKITKTLVLMAQSLGIEVIAEGVETKIQFDFLKEIECDYIQGFYFSKPITINSFETLIQSNI